jgi:PleD family two-component response regulator
MGVSGVTAGQNLDTDAIIKQADDKMYLAKKEPGSFVCY